MAYRIYWIVIILLIFSSCEEEGALTIGKDFIKSQSTIKMVDTFSVRMSTILLDSVPTIGAENMLSGIYTDEYMGKISCTGYFPLSYSSGATLEEKADYDSLTLIMYYTGESYGDTLQPQEVNVHRVLREIEENDDGYLYNVSSFPYSEEPIGSVTVTAKPCFDEFLEIRLSDELGNAIYDSIQENSDFFDSVDDLRKFLYGVAVVPGDQNTAVFAFHADTIQMLLYSHYYDYSGYKVEDTTRFELDIEEGLNFNHVESDRSGTEIADLTLKNNKIRSSATGDKSFIQASTGVVTRFNFPGVSTLLISELDYVFYKAEVEFYPLSMSNSQASYPENIIFYQTDKYDNFVSEITASDGTSITASLELDEQYNEACYTYDVTDFITDELEDADYDPNTGLIMYMTDEKYEGSLERLVIDASPNSTKYRPRLKMYFLYYD